ncbi:MAG: right-handed parallel beta-helix repeat-containing protein [Candidatus Eisenbacteria bacterium]|nr:right-handed parallel beta-helix repeat-containing protein [Candidatus Eisenbacteria bacterium]
MRSIPAFVLCVFLFASCGDDGASPDSGVAEPDTLLVRPDGSGVFPTIQAAIDSAGDGDRILLADGLFEGDGNRDILFRGKKLAVRSESGDAAACAVECGGGEEEYHWGFLFVDGESLDTRIEHITVRGAFGQSGGGMICGGSSPTIADCVFESNKAVLGAALSCVSGADPLVLRCRFRENHADAGGAVWCQDASPTFEECVFDSNLAGAAGGALAGQSSSFHLTGCLFDGNEAGERGGAVSALYESPVIEECVFRGNEGGAVGLENTDQALVESCLFEENDAEVGAAVQCGGSTVLRGCVMTGNSASLFGGAVWCCGSALIEECTFAGNDAPAGSALYASCGDTVRVERCIVSHQGGGEPAGAGSSTTVRFLCADIFGNAGGDWVGPAAGQENSEGNFSGDPLFCDREGGDLRLGEGSPCLPGGHPASVDCGRIGAKDAGCD